MAKPKLTLTGVRVDKNLSRVNKVISIHNTK